VFQVVSLIFTDTIKGPVVFSSRSVGFCVQFQNTGACVSTIIESLAAFPILPAQSSAQTYTDTLPCDAPVS